MVALSLTKKTLQKTKYAVLHRRVRSTHALFGREKEREVDHFYLFATFVERLRPVCDDSYAQE